MAKNMLELDLDANNSKEYKVKTIKNIVFYDNDAESHLSNLYNLLV